MQRWMTIQAMMFVTLTMFAFIVGQQMVDVCNIIFIEDLL